MVSISQENQIESISRTEKQKTVKPNPKKTIKIMSITEQKTT